MPKMKTHRGAAKRFKITGSGKLMRKKAYNGHLFEHKSARKKRSLERETEVARSDIKRIRRTLGIGAKK